LEAALTTLLHDFHSHSGFYIESNFDTQQYKLTSEVATTLYRVAQASLHNIVKHARAKKVTVTLQHMGNMQQLRIRDDCVGFVVNQAVQQQGIGLRNMHEREVFIGGGFEPKRELGFGTQITVLLNLDELVYG
ncbi:sensor histidine kinase, partial [Vibrio sp. 1-2-3a]|uniref:sensor histidine kinase n=1 Tax=Vibrio sp. 1-2-3a TaxID=2650943 RepID=UPI0029289684|nr:histidine kinase [Vibrio sp. 1-2-3a]